MREWIGHYKDIVSHETCDSIMNDDWNWKPSTYSTHEGKNENSSHRVIITIVMILSFFSVYLYPKKNK